MQMGAAAVCGEGAWGWGIRGIPPLGKLEKKKKVETFDF
jgi:hypothetical protein